MKKYDIIFCDLDGTLIETISGEVFPKGVWDMRIRFDVLDTIKSLHPQYVLIVTNQGGIESGFVDESNFRSKIDYIAHTITEYCDCECYAMYCFTNDKSNPYRKPNTGMLETLLEKYVGDDFDCIKQKSLMIGDASCKEGQFSDSDKKTAENFGVDYMDVEDFVNMSLSMSRDEQIIAEAKKHYYDNINCHNAFLHGVEWADEHPVNVWHEASEMPKDGEWILIQFDEDSYDALVFCDMNAVAFRTCCKKCGSIRWAYISDLLPKGGKQ